MSKLCPHCKSKKLRSLSDTVMCCMVCHWVFGKSQLIDDTLFHHITSSPEVLAEEFVEPYIRWGKDGHTETLWESNFRELYGMRFDTKEEAIAATLARLNEVYNGN